MKRPERSKACAKCRATNGELYPCEGGHICDPCLQRHHEGTDSSTRIAKASQWSMAAQAEANRLRQRGEMEDAAQYQLRADQGGNKRWIRRPCFTAPDAAALDASARRIDLLARMGTDSVALGVDAAQSVGAQDEPGEHAPPVISEDPTDIKPKKKAGSLARMRRYRARNRRIDYVPRPDVLAIIEQYVAKGPKNTIAGVIDALIRRGNEAVSGNAGR